MKDAQDRIMICLNRLEDKLDEALRAKGVSK